jgi:hypothetical protein
MLCDSDFSSKSETFNLDLYTQDHFDFADTAPLFVRSPSIELVFEKPASYHKSDEPFVTGPFSPYSTITKVAADGNCGFRAIAIAVYGQENSWAIVRQKMLQQINSAELAYSTEANQTLSTLMKAIGGPPGGGAIYDETYWFSDLSHAGIAADAFESTVLVASRGSSRMRVFPPRGTVWTSAEKPIPPVVGLLFDGVNHWDAFTIDISVKDVADKLFNAEWVGAVWRPRPVDCIKIKVLPR